MLTNFYLETSYNNNALLFSNTSVLSAEVEQRADYAMVFHECLRRVGAAIQSNPNISQSFNNVGIVASSENSTVWRDASEIAYLPRSQNFSSHLVSAMKCSKVIISACCRNVLGHLPKFRANMYRIVSVFHSYQIIFGESDSIDGTLAYLKNWSRNDPNVKVHAFGKLTNSTDYYAGRTRSEERRVGKEC